jgi:hypothetical protein
MIVVVWLLLCVTIALSQQYINSTIIDFQESRATGFNSGGMNGAFDHDVMRVRLGVDTFTEYDEPSANPLFGPDMPYVLYKDRIANIRGPIGIIEVSLCVLTTFLFANSDVLVLLLIVE